MNRYDAWNHWVASAGLLPPVGAVLRVALEARSLRIEARGGHDDEGPDAVHHRHLASGSAALGLGSRCLVLATTWSEEAFFTEWNECPLPLGILERHGLADRESRTTYETIIWGSRDEIEIIDRVAEYGYHGAIAVLSDATGAIYCPDQTGADLVMREAAMVPFMRTLVADWEPSARR